MEARLILPDYWDEVVAFEVENKGRLPARVVLDGHEFAVIFYDPENLAIDVALDLDSGRIFVERNLIVVRRVTVEIMTEAVVALPSGIFEPPAQDRMV